MVLGSKRPLGCSVGSSRAALGQLKSHLGVQDGPKLRAKTAQKFGQDGSRCLQDASMTAQDLIFSQKVKKNESFEFGWCFPFDFNPILSQKYIPDF